VFAKWHPGILAFIRTVFHDANTEGVLDKETLKGMAMPEWFLEAWATEPNPSQDELIEFAENIHSVTTIPHCDRSVANDGWEPQFQADINAMPKRGKGGAKVGGSAAKKARK